MTDYPFLPKSREDVAAIVAQRVSECIEVVVDPTTKKRFPKWVRATAANVWNQILSRETSLAIADRDEDFFKGFVVGMLVALQHLMQAPSDERLSFGRLVALAQAAQAKSSEAEEVAQKITSTPPLEIPDLQGHVLEFVRELGSLPPDKRARVLEGLSEGSAVEEAMTSGGFRIGTAFDVQFLMLFFWPAFDDMPNRRAAFSFLEFCFADRPNLLGSQERFIQLAKRCGYKSRTDDS